MCKHQLQFDWLYHENMTIYKWEIQKCVQQSWHCNKNKMWGGVSIISGKYITISANIPEEFLLSTKYQESSKRKDIWELSLIDSQVDLMHSLLEIKYKNIIIYFLSVKIFKISNNSNVMYLSRTWNITYYIKNQVVFQMLWKLLKELNTASCLLTRSTYLNLIKKRSTYLKS